MGAFKKSLLSPASWVSCMLTIVAVCSPTMIQHAINGGEVGQCRSLQCTPFFMVVGEVGMDPGEQEGRILEFEEGGARSLPERGIIRIF